MLSTRPWRLLVIEDNRADTTLLRAALDEHGVAHEMTILGDGEAALGYLAAIPENSYPELAIIDLNLPKRDGIEVLERFRRHPAFTECRVVVLTSSDAPAERERALAIGVNAYLSKPLDLDGFLALGETFRHLLENPSILSSGLDINESP